MNDKTLGEYKRTTPDPDETTGEALARLQAELTRLLDEADAELRDEADGGVAAALIEKEAEENDAAEVRELRSALARETARGNALQDALDAAESRPLTPDAMTAREYLDAAWEAAYEPECGNVPKGACFLTKSATGVHVRVATEAFGAHGVRLLDSPTPARPEGAEDIEQMVGAWDEGEGGMAALGPEDRRELADWLAARGVRVVGEEQS